MGTTTFTGPVKAGDVLNTTGSTAGTIKNVGFCVMAQSASIVQADTTTATATGICIPANSQILSIDAYVTVAWTGASDDIDIGTTASSNELVANGGLGAVGITALTPGTDFTQTTNWKDVGTSDVIIYAKSDNTGDGVGVLTITYLQAVNLTA